MPPAHFHLPGIYVRGSYFKYRTKDTSQSSLNVVVFGLSASVIQKDAEMKTLHQLTTLKLFHCQSDMFTSQKPTEIGSIYNHLTEEEIYNLKLFHV